MIKSTDNPTIRVKDDDLDSIKLEFRVLNNDEPFDLTDSTVKVAIRKPSLLTVFQDCDVIDASNGLCEVVLTNQAYIEEGQHAGELYIYKGNSVTVTYQFEYTSLDSIMDDEATESINDWQSIHEALLTYDKKPILGEGTPNGAVMPEYIGQMYLDQLDDRIYFANELTNANWLPIGSGGGGGTIEGDVYWADILAKPLTFPPSAHTHIWDEISGKPTEFNPTIHTHTYASLTDKPLTFTPEEHRHDWLDIDNKPATYAPDAHTHDYASITDKPLAFTPEAHAHAITDVTGLTEELASKLEVIPAEYLTQTEGDNRYELKGDGTGEPVATSVDWVDVTNKPLEFPPEPHLHAMTDVSGLDLALGDKSDLGHTHDWVEITLKPTEFPPEAHLHTTADVSGLDIALGDKSDVGHSHEWAEITLKPTTFPPEAHVHDFASITDKPLTYPPDIHSHGWTEITDKPTEFAPEAHGHLTSEISGLDTTLAGKSDVGHVHDYASITDKPTEFAPTAHAHTEADVTLGGINAKTYVDNGDNYILNTAMAGLTLWQGTQTEYNDLAVKEPTTLYFIVG